MLQIYVFNNNKINPKLLSSNEFNVNEKFCNIHFGLTDTDYNLIESGVYLLFITKDKNENITSQLALKVPSEVLSTIQYRNERSLIQRTICFIPINFESDEIVNELKALI